MCGIIFRIAMGSVKKRGYPGGTEKRHCGKRSRKEFYGKQKMVF
jgi:hypothetical protein